jgi:hypothetical protein
MSPSRTNGSVISVAELNPLTVSDPRRNPSYPQRVHIRERAEWSALLKSWEDRVAEARRQLPSRPDREKAAVLIAQMTGALDQIRDAAKRLPMEVGGLYDEDRFRLDLAVSALERLFARWGK